MIKFIDLFAGTGGIRLGLESALDRIGIAHQCVKSIEIDRHACQTYKMNFNEDPYGDIRAVEDIEPFDILLAGFPCQAFSYAGKQLGFADTRGTLFFEIERLIEKYQPKFCFLENVRGLTTHDKGRTLATIIEKLKNQGYYVDYRLLNSSNFGLAQNRVRVYIFASKIQIKCSIVSDVGAADTVGFSETASLDLFFNNAYKRSNVASILEDDPDKKYDCSAGFVDKLNVIFNGDLKKLNGLRFIDTRHGNSLHSWDIGLKGDCTPAEINFMNLLISNRRRHIFGTHQDGKALNIDQIKTFYRLNDLSEVIASLLRKGYLKQNEGFFNPVCGNMSFEVFKFLDPNSISVTLTASDSHKLGVYYKDRVRRITPRECARLQGYPDNYILHPKDVYAYKQLGNAVSVSVIDRLLSNIFSQSEMQKLLKNNNFICKAS
jgi:DNA (cytosine-5)-methyltransferase 1